MPGLPPSVQGRTEALGLKVRCVQRNLETDRPDLIVPVGVDDGNDPGCDRETESEPRAANVP